jgi:hypothetical protein
MQTQLEWTGAEMIERDNNAHAYLRRKGVVDWSFDRDFDGLFLRFTAALWAKRTASRKAHPVKNA